MKINNKTHQIYLFLLIILICCYHFFIQNGIEKLFFEQYFDYESIKRPLERCSSNLNSQNLSCIGMPSGHAETVTIFSTLLYLYKIIPLWVCLLLIMCFSGQRITSKMHTIPQVAAGIFIGYRYAYIYKYFDMSIYSFLIVFYIGLILCLLIVYKINSEVYGTIPSWVDKEMLPAIKKKQDSMFYMKIINIYVNSIIQSRTFITWDQLEKYLDKIVDNIIKSEQKYDAIIGIKTGGAIISEYISQKLNIQNYKIKLSRSEYNCDKKPSDSINDVIQKKLLNNLGEYIICEGIDDDLQGKNVILIDELVSSGKTMVESVKYLKQEKNVNLVYPTCIALNKQNYKQDLQINYLFDGTVIVWPWGYDN